MNNYNVLILFFIFIIINLILGININNQREYLNKTTVDDDIEIDFNDKPYNDLKSKILKIKKDGKPLLIKINSHPCCGKSYFIKKNKGYYKNFKLLDFDNYKDSNRTSKKLLNYNTNTILFGCSEDSIYSNVIYIYVILSKKNMNRNLKNRQTSIPLIQYIYILLNKGWIDSKKIINSRNELQKNLIKDNKLTKPLFYSFQEAIDYCYNIYNN